MQQPNAAMYGSANTIYASTPPEGLDKKYSTVGPAAAPQWTMYDADPGELQAPAPALFKNPKLKLGKTYGAYESRKNLPMDGLLRHFVDENNPTIHHTYLNGVCVHTEANAGYSDDVSDGSGDDDDV